MPSPNQITAAQLNRKIGTPNCPILIDVSIDQDFDADPYLIPTAMRRDFKTIDHWAHEFHDAKVVLICQKGLKLSSGACAILRSKGIDAEFLEGGNQGWRKTGLMRIPAATVPIGPMGHSVWVTRDRPKIDRIACPWLIRRFIDPNAQFLFVPATQVLDVAEKYSATPFDSANTFWGHRGDHCSFDTFTTEFGLNSAPLMALARIVRAADTGNLELAPEAAGLLAASLGLSRIHRDDNIQLEAGLPLYDAFYRWARDASNETHTHPTGASVS
ncbi:sulfurtransferase [Amylibacter marinus]|uniref:Sulfurtransferase n=1 Tax=Amylibacter marinus TaxID=1475483 RepID=A0ABQ5VRU5_9RHOB|nr:sulfurtransferase/chromate resistance protein [Amylibacter marinus]GLQ33823.1 sulfurtransferase [Amylibacter marinus]